LLELASGRAYVDNDGRRGAARVEIVTAIATVTDVGTQFEVNLAGDRYRLRVREGRVRLRLGAERIDGIAGDELTVGSDGAVARRSIAPTDDEWRWVESVATAPDVNDQPVTALLTWVARETGRVIRFKDAEVKRRAAATILHGSIRHLAPLDALSVMLATTDLDYVELSDGTLLIHARSAR
jgi:ferric-dicitrate binding protein FerR (iron transport regulator)